MWLHLFDRGLAESLATDSGGIMNPKEELQKDFLKLQKILRELKRVRYDFLQHPELYRIEDSIALLTPLIASVEQELATMQRPIGDYDI